MTTRTYEIVTALFFAVIAVVHVMRLASGWPVLLGTMSVPMWASALAIVVSMMMAIWGFSLLRRQG